MVIKLKYEPLEKLRIPKPVNRISYITKQACGKLVLDIGCLDETALCKKGTGQFLHEQIASVAKFVVGVDNSENLPDKGLTLAHNSRIIKADIRSLNKELLGDYDFDLIVAGEFIEHLPDSLTFLKNIKNIFAGKRFILTTPNATSSTNILLAVSKRESSHKDHLQVYSYKTLNSLCLRAGFMEWDIFPYYSSYAESILAGNWLKSSIASCAEKVVNLNEWLLPLFSGGFIVDIKL